MTTDRFREFADDVLIQPAISAGDRVKDLEAVSNLRRLPRARWRSLGQHLDYSNWPDRERFMELDRAIEASRILAASQWRGPHRNAA